MTDDGGAIAPAAGAPAPGGRWQVSVGSARGAAHQATGLPNQDAVAYRDASGPGGAVMVAIADGHGHSRHFRSGYGSALAVDTACQVAAGLAAGLAARAGHGALSQADVDAAAAAQLAPALVRDWRAAVAAHLAQQPFTAQEQASLDADGDEPEIAYGATLLVVTVLARWLICAQIGDGDMLAIQPGGQSFSPVPTLEKLGGERTRSLCQPDALAAFRVAVFDLDARPLAAVLLATDGYGNSQTADPWQPGVGRDVARFAAEQDHAWFQHQVPGWAQRCASADGSGDDTTIALLVHPGLPAGGPQPRPAAAAGLDSGGPQTQPAGPNPPPLAGTPYPTVPVPVVGVSSAPQESPTGESPTATMELDRAGPPPPAQRTLPIRTAAPSPGAGLQAVPRRQADGRAGARGSGVRAPGPGGLPPTAGITSARRTVVLIAGAIALAALAAVLVVLFALRPAAAPGPARHVQPASRTSAVTGPQPGRSTSGAGGSATAGGSGQDGKQAKASGSAGTEHEGDS